MRWALFGLLWPALVLSVGEILPDFDNDLGFGLFFLERTLNAVSGLPYTYTMFRIAFWGIHPSDVNYSNRGF